MFVDTYKTESDVEFDFNIGVSKISNMINLIDRCGVKLKDIQMIENTVVFIPMNIREMKSKESFLKNVGFSVTECYMYRD